jgi:acid phosphatase (class A)
MTRFVFPLAAIAVSISASAFAADAVYVQASQTHILQILAAPPASDSVITKNELVLLHQLQETRTPEQVAAAIVDDKDESMFLYRTVLGSAFNPAQLPLTAALSKNVGHDESANTKPGKSEFHRVRPYNLDKTLQPVCKTKTIDDSYPSGHTTAGYLQALVLVEMVPEQRDAILARTADFGHNRLVCGVHYPTDLEASRALAYAIHAVMDTNPQFQRDMSAARVELRKALGLAQIAQ